MSEIAADLQFACSDLLSEAGIEEFQQLGPDAIPPRACARARGDQGDAVRDAPRDAKGRFAEGHSGNPKGRPPGIRNPRRRPLGLLLRQARSGTLAPLIRRKRYLRLPLLRLVLPPPAREPDPGDRLGIDFSRMRSADQIAAAIPKILSAIGRGEIAPADGLRLVRRSRKPLRAMRRRLCRDLARLEAMRRGSAVLPPYRGGEPGPDSIRLARRARRRASEGLVPPPLAGEVAREARRRGQNRSFAATPLHHAAHGPPPARSGGGARGR